MKTFCIGDIHGNFVGLKEVLQLSNFNYQEDRLICLGDIVDRGEQVYECVEELLKINNLVTVMGNHDQCFLNFLERGFHGLNWTHGGEDTIKSYSKYIDRHIFIQRGFGRTTTNLTKYDIPDTHLEFFKNMKPYHIENDCLFIHGGFNDEIELEENDEMEYYWNREMFDEAQYRDINQFKTIYIGHTPTIYFGETVPMKRHNVINVDTGSSKGGKLTIMNLEDGKFWQST